jgi:hypothetical protein
VIVGHIMGLPVEESVLQLAPAGVGIVTAVTVAGRMGVRSLRRRLGHGLREADRQQTPVRGSGSAASPRRGRGSASHGRARRAPRPSMQETENCST